MGYFWLALSICWLSTLIFLWSVIRLYHNPRSKPRLDAPPHRPQVAHDRQVRTPEGLLRQHFVAGEITAEEYERLLDILLRITPPPTKGSNTPIIAGPAVPRVSPYRGRGIDRRAALILLATCTIGTVLLATSMERSGPVRVRDSSPMGGEAWTTEVPEPTYPTPPAPVPTPMSTNAGEVYPTPSSE